MTTQEVFHSPIVETESNVWRRWWLLAALCAVATLLIMPLDGRISHRLYRVKSSDDLRKFIALGETFGHSFGVGLILLSTVVLDPRARRRLPRLLALSYGAGLIANVGKLLVARVRPHHWDLDAASASSSFVDWFPMARNTYTPLMGESASVVQSFPSAHTATAAGLMLALTWLYPRGFGLFLFFSALVAVQRIEIGAHWPSDTLASFPVAIAWGWFVFHGRLNSWFTTWETKL